MDGRNRFNPVKIINSDGLYEPESSLFNSSTVADVEPTLLVEDNHLDETEHDRLLGELSVNDEYHVSAITKKSIQTKKVISSFIVI